MADQSLVRRAGARGLSAVNRSIRMRRQLEWNVVENAIVVPLIAPQDVSRGAGVLRRRDGRVDHVKGTRLRRFMRQMIPRPESRDLATERSVPIGLFGGYLFNHFGHFLLESLCRLWIENIEEIDRSVPLIWIKWDAFEMPEWMIGICRRIALDRELILLDSGSASIAVDELIVPQPGFELREWMHPAQMARMGATAWRPDTSDRRIWLSRSGMQSTTGITQQQEIERALQELGWSIVRPETMPIDEQIDLLASASHIAGVEGSALHGLVLVGGFGGTVDIVRRDASPNYDVVATAGGWDQRIHTLQGRVVTASVTNGLRGTKRNRATRVTIDGIDPVAVARTIHESSCRRPAHRSR